ncbi:MAG: nuclear transport factor 2 family protein [Novosphingobium sp.]|nr:nuclear transport factor 2 family protein [Novosphingobium sp.]
MDRAEYQKYADAFNSRNYDAVYDFYAEDVEIAFFGVNLGSREEFKRFYNLLHAHIVETLTISKFASSPELVALEGTIRVEATRTLPASTLEEAGLPTTFAIEAGQVLEMPQYIHYHLNEAGKITSVGCTLAS